MIRALVGSVALVVALSACSGAGDTPVTPPTPTLDVGKAMTDVLASCLPPFGQKVSDEEMKLCVGGAAARAIGMDNHLPFCQDEDQTSDCFWDASRLGNMRGHSFVVWAGVRYDLVANTQEKVR